MVDGSQVPSFIRMLEPEPGYRYKKVYVFAEEDRDVGHYELQIVTTLASPLYQDHLVPHLDHFNVTVVPYPYT